MVKSGDLSSSPLALFSIFLAEFEKEGMQNLRHHSCLIISTWGKEKKNVYPQYLIKHPRPHRLTSLPTEAHANHGIGPKQVVLLLNEDLAVDTVRRHCIQT